MAGMANTTGVGDGGSMPFILSVKDAQLHGFVCPGDVACFLGLQYATIPARFRTAVPLCLDQLAGPIDLTQYGPACPQHGDSLRPLMRNMFERIPNILRTDELHCLHLNIYAPAAIIRERRKSPVLVLLHGGGFTTGENTSVFDGYELVKRSIDSQRPIVVVAVNYRLNLFGFLSSVEIQAEASALGETPVLNQGLHDQRLAFQWLSSHIHNFGGDPENITALGESAGAAAILYHLHGGMPLFRQAILQSCPAWTTRPADATQLLFNALVKDAGVSLNAPDAEKLAGVRNLSPKAVLKRLETARCVPLADPHWFVGAARQPLSFVESGFCDELPAWCERIICGHTRDESSLFLAPLAKLPSEHIAALAYEVDPQMAPFSAGDLVDTQAAMRHVSAALSLYMFTSVSARLALGVPKIPNTSLFFYKLQASDPYPGPLKGLSWHAMTTGLTLCNKAALRNPAIKATASVLFGAHMRFLYGDEPWPCYIPGVFEKRLVLDGLQTGMEEWTPDSKTDIVAIPPALLRILTMLSDL